MIGFSVILSNLSDIAHSAKDGESFVYIGKTVDLQLKVEPEKSVDLDNGSTEVGAYKITASFSVINDVDIENFRYLYLLPVDFGNGAMCRVDLRHSKAEVKGVESKTGEFEKWQVSIVRRAPVEVLGDILSYFAEVGTHMTVLILPSNALIVAVEGVNPGEEYYAERVGSKGQWGVAMPPRLYGVGVNWEGGGGAPDEMVTDSDGGMYIIGEDKSFRRIA